MFQMSRGETRTLRGYLLRLFIAGMFATALYLIGEGL